MASLLYRLLLFLVVTSVVSSFQLPDLGEVFSSFYQQKQSVSNNEDANTPKERVKRQNQRIGDESALPHVVTSSVLPRVPSTNEVNVRYMPTLGNGHLATTAFSNTVYLNGFYNGQGSETHRAAIPAFIMGQIEIANEEVDRRASKKYSMDVQKGYFEEKIDCDFGYIEQKMYVHEYYIRLLVRDITYKIKNPQIGGGKFRLTFPGANVTDDLTFSEEKFYRSHLQRTARTKVAEADGVETETIHMFALDPVSEIAIQSSDTTTQHYTIVMTIDRDEGNARSEFDEALEIIRSRNGPERLLQLHVDAWKKVWDTGHVEVFGDSLVSKITMFSQYYLLSSLPSLHARQPPKIREFVYGVSRTSLAKGGAGKDFQGHVSWDNEMYILPPLMLFQPELVKRALRYRQEMSESAKEIASSMGASGYKYPFRSAISGQEVSPGDCPECENQKYHVSGAVAWGIRQYFSATRDYTFLNDEYYRACDITREVARFYASRTSYDNARARYTMGKMTGPDETYPDRVNNAYTLVLASMAIHWARYMACLCQRSEREEVPDEWVQMALYYDLPFDNVRRRHPQFEGFFEMNAPRVNQADTIMITYPISWNVSRDIMRHDLEYYETLTNTKSPAMTWSFFTVGWKWVGEFAKMQSFFLKSYQDYLISPFKIWTEFTEEDAIDQRNGAVNYLPGMGGFLQSLIYGFAGIRIRPEKLEFHNPQPPPDSERIRLVGLQYLGNRMNVEIDRLRVVIEVLPQDTPSDNPLVLRRNQSSSVEESLLPGSVIEIRDLQAGFFIYTNKRTGCEHPRDHMYMPWGYSPFVEAGSHVTASVLTLVALLILTQVSTLWNTQSIIPT